MKKSNLFKTILKGKVVLFGVGNRLRGDDAFGPLMIDRLQGKVNAVCINAENAPEKFLGKVIKLSPDTLFIIDAVHLGLGPGEYRIVRPEDLEGVGFSTHDISLKTLIAYIKTEVDTDVYILGVQPRRLGIGDTMSAHVKKTMRKIEDLIIKVLAEN